MNNKCLKSNKLLKTNTNNEQIVMTCNYNRIQINRFLIILISILLIILILLSLIPITQSLLPPIDSSTEKLSLCQRCKLLTQSFQLVLNFRQLFEFIFELLRKVIIFETLQLSSTFHIQLTFFFITTSIRLKFN
jgi:hypothetical protein